MAKKKSWKRRLRDWLVGRIYERGRNMTLRQAVSWKAWQIFTGANKGVTWPVHPSSVVVHADRIKLGERTRPGYSNGVYIQATNGIEFGDWVGVAPGAGIISANHDLQNFRKHVPGPPIKIGNRCWIGKNAVVLPGVTLGDDVVVGAGAVVTKSFPSGVTVAGVPAEIIRETGPIMGRGNPPAAELTGES